MQSSSDSAVPNQKSSPGCHVRDVSATYGDEEASRSVWQEEAPKSDAITAKQQSQWDILVKYPYIYKLPLLLFLLLIAFGFTMIFTLGSRSESNEIHVKHEAVALAKETALHFANKYLSALEPARQLARAASGMSPFQELPNLIGPAGRNGSLPLIPPPNDPLAQPTYRNVTGVCDGHVRRSFLDLAATLLDHSPTAASLVSFQLAPYAVICLTYSTYEPENLESSEERIDLKHHPSSFSQRDKNRIGQDFLLARRNTIQPVLQGDTMKIDGPMSIRNVQEAFIARLPIVVDGFSILDGVQVYDKWGFATIILDWGRLIADSSVFEIMAEADLAFRLVRTEGQTNIDSEGNTRTAESFVSLAETFDYDAEIEGRQTYTTPVLVEGDEWIMTIGFFAQDVHSWTLWAALACTVGSLVISWTVYIGLWQRQTLTITQEERSQLVLKNAEEMARSERELNEFLAHEVRNPVSAALSASVLLSSAVEEVQPLKDSGALRLVQSDVGVIQTSLKFVNDLLRNMLDIHRAASNQLTLTPVPTDLLRDVFEPVACMLYRHDSFEVLTDCPRGLWIKSDPVRLKQIMLNLGRNAAQFVEKGFVRLRAQVDNECLYLYVEDSGPGIPQETRGGLFNKFQERLDTVSQGTGIGLHLCQRLVKLLGGEIWLDQSYKSGVEGHPGARFSIRFPASLILPDFAIPDSQTTLSDLPDQIPLSEVDSVKVGPVLPDQLSILFVDDDTILRKLFTRSINKLNKAWIVAESASGEAALHLTEHQRFDLIFMDQYMASTTKSLLGTETVRALRAKHIDSTICGLSANDLEEPFLSAGADAFVMKPLPCKKDELQAALLRILNNGCH